MQGCGDLSRYEESKKAGIAKDTIQEVKVAAKKTTAVLFLKDILKKENPSGVLETYEHEEENSSFSKKKREAKEERKRGIKKNGSKNPGEIKKALEKIVKYNAGKVTAKGGKQTIKKAVTPG